MNAGSIFKMEFYKNFRDRVWLIIIGVLAVLVLSITLVDIATIEAISRTGDGGSVAFLALVAALSTFFVFIGFYAFLLIYPFHLLSTDYSNKSLSLMVASGVNRGTYYFIKILATILTYLMSIFVITILPIIIIFGVYQAQILNFLSEMFRMIFTGNELWMTGINNLLAQLAGVVTLFFVVILTRGKFWGIFVYLGIQMVVGIFTTLLSNSFAAGVGLTGSLSLISAGAFIPRLVISIIVLIAFGISGLLIIRHQDL